MSPHVPDSGPLSPDTLSQVFAASPSAMLLVAADGRIRLANHQAERLFGYEAGQLAGHQVEALLPEQFRGAHCALRAGYFAAPVARPMGERRDLYALRRDGVQVPVEIGLNPIRTGQGLLVLAAIIDISQRRRSEDLLRSSLAEKEALLREIHHRVNNNMQVVSSLLNLQSAAVEDPRHRELFDECQTRVRAMALVHEQLYAGTDLAALDCHRYVTELSNLLFATYQPPGCRVQLQISTTPWAADLESAIPLGLILHEWITNALKHAFLGRQNGVLRVVCRELPDGMHELRVADNGRGLPPDFTPERSTGLGFRLIQTLIRPLRGELQLESVPDAGTTLTLRFAAPAAG